MYYYILVLNIYIFLIIWILYIHNQCRFAVKKKWKVLSSLVSQEELHSPLPPHPPSSDFMSLKHTGKIPFLYPSFLLAKSYGASRAALNSLLSQGGTSISSHLSSHLHRACWAWNTQISFLPHIYSWIWGTWQDKLGSLLAQANIHSPATSLQTFTG